MKDKNNLLTSLIVALLAGGVYYLAGADSIEKFIPQITRVDNKDGIEVVYSKVKKEEENLADCKVQLTPKKQTRKNVNVVEADETEVTIPEEMELASSSEAPPMKFNEVIALLENPEKESIKLSKMDGTEQSFEWIDKIEDVEKPAIAWTDSEFSHSLKVRVQTKYPVIYSKAEAAIFLREVKQKSKDKLHSSADKKEFKETNDGAVSNSNVNTTKVPVVKGVVGKVVIPPPPGYNVIWDAKDVQNNVKVEVKTSSEGYNFIMIQSDDDCQTKCPNSK